MNVLSLFDGMSCGQQALERAGIKVENYFASEIDKHAIIVTMANYPATIQLGSVVDIDVSKLPKIDLLIGGSPCQSFSFAGRRKGMSTKDSQEVFTLDHYLQLKSEGYEFEGQSYLFWEYMRILNAVREINPNVLFLLENVIMEEKWESILSQAIGVKPIEINSALVSAQNRRRFYWTNIGLKPKGLFGYLYSTIEQPKDKKIILKDILENELGEKYFLSNDEFTKIMNCKAGVVNLIMKDGKAYFLGTINSNENEVIGLDYRTDEGLRFRENGKSPTLTCRGNTIYQGVMVCVNKIIRKLTPIEYERLQNVKDNYTNHVLDSQRYKMLGNGWTIDVIAHIFSYLNK